MIEFFAFLLLSCTFFQFRLSLPKIIAVCMIAYLLNCGALIYLSQDILFKLVLGYFLFSLLAGILYSAPILHCIVLSVLFFSLINVLDSLLAFLFSSLFHQNFSAMITNPFSSSYLQTYSAKTIELTIAAFIHAWGRQRFYKRQPSILNFVKLTLFPTLSLICTVTLLSKFSAYPQSPLQLLFCIIALLISYIVSILLLTQFELQQQAVLDSRILQRELKLAHDNVAELLASYHKERKLSHDFQNELAVIQGLLKQEQASEVVQNYIDQLMKRKYTLALAVSTHRPVADVLLNQKYTSAKEKEIQFQVQLDDLSAFPLPDDALVIVLSNLLGNALEACEKINNPSDRFILVKAKVDVNESILYIENSVSNPVQILNGKIATSKRDKLQHGYGLQNVSSIIKSFGGVFAIHCEGQKFVFVASFMNK